MWRCAVTIAAGLSEVELFLGVAAPGPPVSEAKLALRNLLRLRFLLYDICVGLKQGLES